MNGGVLGMVAAGSRKLAAQIVVSVIATGCAAVAVPQILSGLGYGEKPQTTVQRPLVAAPVDFEAAFVWPVATPPGVPATSSARPCPNPPPPPPWRRCRRPGRRWRWRGPARRAARPRARWSLPVRPALPQRRWSWQP